MINCSLIQMSKYIGMHIRVTSLYEFGREKAIIKNCPRHLEGLTVKISKAELAASVLTVAFIAAVCIYSAVTSVSGGEYRIISQHTADSRDIFTGGDGVSVDISSSLPENGADCVDINSAGIEELTSLDGIGETLAQRIIDYRQEHGVFSDLSEIMNVPGIGQGIYEKIAPYITIVEETP